MASASGSWLMAISTGRPNACSRPVLVPPPPAKLSMISSLPRSSDNVKLSRLMIRFLLDNGGEMPEMHHYRGFEIEVHATQRTWGPQKGRWHGSFIVRQTPEGESYAMSGVMR